MHGGLILFCLVVGAMCAARASEFKHKYLFADEGNRKLVMVDQFTPANDWETATDGNNRDMQLVGRNRVMVSTPKNDNGGYYEFDLTTGAKKKEVLGFGMVQSARRTKNLHTFLGVDGGPTYIIELDSNDKEIRRFTIENTSTLRLMRRTPQGTFFFGSNDWLIEADTTGKKIWEAQIGGQVYQAMRLPDGNIISATGYEPQVKIINAQKEIIKRIPESTINQAEINHNFYAGFQILKNWHIVVTNWQAHGAGNGNQGIQCLEYDSSGALVGQYDQDASRISSLHGVLVLDSLNLELMHDDINGILAPVDSPDTLHQVEIMHRGIRPTMPDRLKKTHSSLSRPQSGAEMQLFDAAGRVAAKSGSSEKHTEFGRRIYFK
jgi:hypothetical protein